MWTLEINQDRSNLVSDIQRMNEEFLREKKKWCPYSAMISFLHKCGGLLTKTKMPQINQLISKLIHTNLTSPVEVEWSFHWKDEVKITKFAYDSALLELEVYDLMHSILSFENTNAPMSKLNHLAWDLNLQDLEVRKQWFFEVFALFQRHVKNIIPQWETAKMEDKNYKRILDHALSYSQLSKGRQSTYGQLFVSGSWDGFMNFRSIVTGIPELYKKKYNQMLSTELYRDLVKKNVKNVLLPLTTLNLTYALNIVRSPEDMFSRSEKEHITNVLNIGPESYFLDDEWLINIKKEYMEKVTQRLENLSSVLQARSDARVSVTLWCPALRAHKGDKNLIEHFFEDISKLLDEMYFPYRDKK